MKKAITIMLGEHKVTLPDMPTDTSEILFYDEPEQEAYWKRQTDFPPEFFKYNKYITKTNQEHTIYDSQTGELISLSVADTVKCKELQARELKRRSNGVWFKNGRQVIWMPGDYYFALQWAPMKGLPQKYGDFRWFQNDFMILRWYAQHNPDILGIVMAKSKKTGITQIMAAAYVNKATMTRDKTLGLMSKTYDQDAILTNMDMIFLIIDELPDILRPEIGKRNSHEIRFRKGNNRKNLKDITVPLNSHIFASKTKASGFDGPKMEDVWIDEYMKTWEASGEDLEVIFSKSQETVKIQQEIVGKMCLTSYAPEKDDKGYRAAKKIYDDAALKTKSPITGRTKNGLINYFISALDSTQGCFDKQGRCDRKKALALNQLERDAVANDAPALLAKKRQYPRTEEECWGEEDFISTFDLVEINKQIKVITDEMDSGVLPWKQGRLRWRNPLWESGKFDLRPKGEFCEVYFEEEPNNKDARLRIYQEPFEKDKNRFLMTGRDFKGRPIIESTSLNIGAIDPTDFANASDVEEGSLNAMGTMNMPDIRMNSLFGKKVTDVLLSDYLYRPENPLEAYEDAVKEILYFNKRVLIEANKKWMVTMFKQDFLHNFLLVRKSNGMIDSFRESEENSLTSTTRDIIDQYIRLIREYFAKPISDHSVYNMLGFKSLRVLEQMKGFKPDKPKKFDAVVMFGLMRLAIDSLVTKYSVKNEKTDENMAEIARVVLNRLINM